MGTQGAGSVALIPHRQLKRSTTTHGPSPDSNHKVLRPALGQGQMPRATILQDTCWPPETKTKAPPNLSSQTTTPGQTGDRLATDSGPRSESPSSRQQQLSLTLRTPTLPTAGSDTLLMAAPEP